MTNKSTSIICGGLKIFSALLGLLLLGSVQAAENHWTGTAGDNLWANAANWSLGVAPDGTQDVFVEQTGTDAVILNSWVEVASISLGGDAGAATLNIAGGQLDCYGAAVIATNAVLNLAGDFLGAWPLTVNGTINWTAGQLSAGTIAISPAANLNISGTGLKTLAAGVANDGTVSCFATSLNAFPGCYFTNNNRFVLQSDFALSQSPGTFPGPEFHNQGTILLPAGMGQNTFTLGVQFFNEGTIEVDTNSVLEIASQDDPCQFQNGTVFNGAGLLRFPANSYVTFDGTLTLDGTLEFGGTSLDGWPTWTGPGLLRWTGGGMGGFTFAPGFHVEITGPDDKTFSGGCTNLGTVQWQSSGRLMSTGDSGFVNLGQFLIETNCVLESWSWPFWPSGNFTNAGTLLRPADGGTAQLQVNGTSFFNQGTIEVDTNSVLEIVSYDSQFQNGTVFNGAGLLRFSANSYVTFDGTLTLNGTLEFGGSSLNGWPTWTGPGLLRWTGGGMGGFTFAPGFHAEISGPDDKTFSGGCTNLGTVQWQSSGRLMSTGDSGFVNLGQFVIETNCVLDSWFWPGGSFTNAGTLLRPADGGTAQLQVNGTSFFNQGTIEVDTNSVLEIVSYDSQFQNGTVFNGAGLLRFSANSYVTFDGTLTLNGTLEFGGSSLNGWPTWTGPGLLRWAGGGMGGFTFAPGFHAEISGPNDKTFSGGCTNLGTVQWQSSGRLMSTGDSGFVNLGQFVIETNCVLDSWFWPSGSFTNAGTLLRPADGGTAQLLVNGTSFFNQGTIEVDTNSVLEIATQDYYLGQFQNGTVFNGAGLLRFPANSYVTFDGTMTLDGTLEFGGSSFDGWPTWTGPGLLRWTGGVMSGFTFAPGFHGEITGPDDKYFSGNCTNLGTICWAGDSSVSSSGGATFNNGGLFLVKTNGNWDATLPFNNQPGGIFRQIAGQFSLGTLNNSGTLKLEKGMLNPGDLTATGGASYESSLDGNTPGIGFNQVHAQNLGLDGSLLVTLTNGFVPTNGSSFVIATGVSRTGQFASVTLPPAQSNLTWRVRYTPNEVILQASSPLAASGSTRLGDGSFQFILSGPEAAGYVIQASTNMTDWFIIETNSPFTGNLIFTDPDAGQFPHRFYRCQIFD